MLAMVKGIEPRDQVEAMLAAQMAAVHNATMTFARRLNHVENIPQQDSAERLISVQACRLLLKGAKPSRFEDHPTAPVTPVHSLVAIARNGRSRSIGTLGRNQLESVVAISRCAQRALVYRVRAPTRFRP